MKELDRLLSLIRQACERYRMIGSGDRIAVGLSGGKDSLALLYALNTLRGFYPEPFSLCAVTVDPGFPKDSPAARGPFEPLSELCASLGVEHRIVKTDIYAVVFEERREKNPCSLCANMRRGALTDAALSFGANKLALGHHLDDAAETFFMNLTANGRIGCFSPVTAYEDRGLSVIRPLIYAREREVAACVRAAALPVIQSPCPANGATGRAETRELLRALDAKKRGLYRRILGAMERAGVDGWHGKE